MLSRNIHRVKERWHRAGDARRNPADDDRIPAEHGPNRGVAAAGSRRNLRGAGAGRYQWANPEAEMVLYGIASCDTCRKARAALKAAGHPVTFRDIRAQPLTGPEIGELLAAFGPALVNRSSATWRGLGEAERAGAPAALIAAHPTLMKRPVIRADGRLHLGWTPAVQAALLN